MIVIILKFYCLVQALSMKVDIQRINITFSYEGAWYTMRDRKTVRVEAQMVTEKFILEEFKFRNLDGSTSQTLRT